MLNTYGQIDSHRISVYLDFPDATQTDAQDVEVAIRPVGEDNSKQDVGLMEVTVAGMPTPINKTTKTFLLPAAIIARKHVTVVVKFNEPVSHRSFVAIARHTQQPPCS